MSNAEKNFDILATSLSVLHNYFDNSTKLFFLSVFSKNFRSFSKISVQFISRSEQLFNLIP